MPPEPFSQKVCNPFAADIFPDGLEVAGTLEVEAALHEEAWERMEEEVLQAEQEAQHPELSHHGKVILLRAPRAGYGKSHLLHRLRGSLSGQAIMVPLEFENSEVLTWKLLFHRVVEALDAAPSAPEMEGATALDQVARCAFARVNASMIRAGEVPCEKPEEAAEVLAEKYMQVFDFGGAGRQVVSAWYEDHFEALLPVSAPHLQDAAGLGASATVWLRAFCSYAQGGAQQDPARLGTFRWALRQPADSPPGTAGSGMVQTASPETEPEYRERLGQLCRLTALAKPLVVILDHLDGYHGSAEKVLRLANFLSDWRRMSGRIRYFLSVNHDLWTQTFLKALPSALEDRLTGGQIALGGISRDAAGELIGQRLEQWKVPEPVAAHFLQHLALDQYFAQEAGRMISPRAILRYAAQAWQDRWNSAPVPAPEPAESVLPAARMREMLDRLKSRNHPPARVSSAGADSQPAAPPPARSHARVYAEPAAAGMDGEKPRASLHPADSVAPGDPFAALGVTGGWQPIAEAAAGSLAGSRVDSPPVSPAPEGSRQAGYAIHRPPGGVPASGAILPDPAPPPGRNPPPGGGASVSPFRAAGPTPGQVLQVRFQTLRNHFASSPWLILDQDRLYHLIKLSGQRLALVRFLETGLPSLPGAIAGVWQSPDAEVLFGSEPYEDRHYWAALIDFARQRAAYVPGSRLVLFSSAPAPVNPGIWLQPEEIASAIAKFLDVQSLDHSGLAALYAVDEVLRECERGALPLNVTDGFASMAPHLEGLWKRLTRPMVPSES